MIVVMSATASQREIQAVLDWLQAQGLDVHISQGQTRTVLGIIGDRQTLRDLPVEALDGVEKAIPVTHSYKLVSQLFQQEPTVIEAAGVQIGNNHLVVMAGPCAVESREMLFEVAYQVKQAGAHFLRGGAFKPRTSPYSFQGLRERGLQLLAEAREHTGLGIVTEVMAPEQVEMVSQYADILQVGTRNMQNYDLLRAIGKSKRPVLLKRGFAATIDEWLNAAEYIMCEGNYQVILCERGIRTYEPMTRNTLDISAIPLVKGLTHLPVLVDPSHASGKWQLVAPLSRAAVAAGADGLIIEVHPDPTHAVSDGPQSLKPEKFAAMMNEIRQLAPLLGKELP
ncbi:MAG: 3-deoxy-7-phosphoheptulonate synthase [bacterium]|jgi:3-deoxy-7-phosphoheptulonate synthase